MLMLLPQLSLAEQIPKHAHKNTYGTGWACDRGFYRANNECLKVTLPLNAQLNYAGSGWVCSRGFYQANNQCHRVSLPENAQLNYTGNGWVCTKGYYKTNGKCVKVSIPRNAQLNYAGNGWVCQRGFSQSGEQCISVALPKNAELNYAGNGWICSKGFYKLGKECLPVKLPENAQLNFAGNGWVCKDGFKKLPNSCAKMTPQEIKKQQDERAALMAYIQKKRAMGVSGDDCENEYKTNAEVCIRVTSGDINCHESLYGGYYDYCDVSLSYDVETDYKGGSYLDTSIRCDVEIEYKGRDDFMRRSDSDNQEESYDLYTNDSTSNTMDFNFSFSSFNEIISAKINSAQCEIESVDLW